MTENNSAHNPFELAIDKARSTTYAAPHARSSSSRQTSGNRQRPGETGQPVDGLDLSRFPVSDADFERFEMRFGIGPGQQSTFDNAFRMVRTQILQDLQQKDGQVIGITSPAPRNGKTVCSIHLARACARRPGQAVVLADLNLQRPLLAGYLDARDFASGIGFFRGEGPADKYLNRVSNSNLLLFMSDRGTSQSAELLSSSRLRDGLRAFRDVAPGTVVILNLPPIIGSDDVMSVLPELDGVILVAAAGESKFGEVDEAAKMIPKDKMLCALLNKAKGVSAAATSD